MAVDQHHYCVGVCYRSWDVHPGCGGWWTVILYPSFGVQNYYINTLPSAIHVMEEYKMESLGGYMGIKVYVQGLYFVTSPYQRG